MYENIRSTFPNFCIGPQSGTYCIVNVDNSPVNMTVKNSSGSIIRNYSFYPSNVLNSGPYTSTVYPFNEFVGAQYVGPQGQSSFFNGAVFFTLERIKVGNRLFYTYDRDPEFYGPYKTSNNKLITATEAEYRGNIVRKWKVDSANFRLVLDTTYVLTETASDWIDGTSFAIENVKTSFAAHSAKGTGEIKITDTSRLSKYDTLILGPSTDADNYGLVEEVYVHSIDGTSVQIRTYGGSTPTKYEYISGDPITVLNNICLFSKSEPIINSEGIREGYTSEGLLYRLSLSNYGEVVSKDENCLYYNVRVSGWNNYLHTLSFIKGLNLIHLNASTYDVVKSQYLSIESGTKDKYLTVYDIDFSNRDIYKLQKEIFQRADLGLYTDIVWTTYNYHIDSLEPYTCSVTIEADTTILAQQGSSFLKATVRDQFGVGLLNKTVYFSKVGDSLSYFDVVGGAVLTDSNGVCNIKYTSGELFSDFVKIYAKVGGANTVFGSSNVSGYLPIEQRNLYISDFNLVCVEDYSLGDINIKCVIIDDSDCKITCFVRRMFPGGEYVWNNSVSTIEDPTIEDRNNPPNSAVSAEAYTLSTVYQPIFNQLKIDMYGNSISTSSDFAHLYVAQTMLSNFYKIDFPPEVFIMCRSITENTKYISQNFISRHKLYGHLDQVSFNQYIFIQEAIPPFWSEKNSVGTYYWIRLRPFADNLDPSTLKILLREESVAGDTGWYDITLLGTITMYDAGSGLLGIDFYYQPMNDFHYESIVYVNLEVYDRALIPNKFTTDYWFKLIQDFRPPHIENMVPYRDQVEVDINTVVTFDLIDSGEGVDITYVEVYVNNRDMPFSYIEYEPGNFHISCLLSQPFDYAQVVSVTVVSIDRSNSKNKDIDGWYFSCADSTGPWFDIDNVSPGLCLKGVKRNTSDVSIQVYAVDDTGIDTNSIKMEIGGKYRDILVTPIVYRLE